MGNTYRNLRNAIALLLGDPDLKVVQIVEGFTPYLVSFVFKRHEHFLIVHVVGSLNKKISLMQSLPQRWEPAFLRTCIPILQRAGLAAGGCTWKKVYWSVTTTSGMEYLGFFLQKSLVFLWWASVSLDWQTPVASAPIEVTLHIRRGRSTSTIVVGASVDQA